MNDKKIKSKIIIILLLLIMIAFGGVSLAYLMNQSQLINRFEIGEIKTEIVETFENNVKKDVKIHNIGNASAYVRCKIVAYYEYNDGRNTLISEYVPKKDIDYKLDLNENDWFENKGIYYYKYPLDPNAYTTNLINEATSLKTYDNDRLVIDIYVQAIQSEPYKAVQEAWKEVKINRATLELNEVIK